MKKQTFSLLMTVIWGLGTIAWIGCLFKDAGAGTVDGFHIVTAVLACVTFAVSALNLFQYTREGKKKD